MRCYCCAPRKDAFFFFSSYETLAYSQGHDRYSQGLKTGPCQVVQLVCTMHGMCGEQRWTRAADLLFFFLFFSAVAPIQYRLVRTGLSLDWYQVLDRVLEPQIYLTSIMK